MPKQKCIACGSATLKQANLTGNTATLQPVREQEWEPNWKGVSDVSVKVCSNCGYVSLFAEKPRLFRDES